MRYEDIPVIWAGKPTEEDIEISLKDENEDAEKTERNI